jgi:ABC-type proline/glycine betaine transport system permease subunit
MDLRLVGVMALPPWTTDIRQSHAARVRTMTVRATIPSLALLGRMSTHSGLHTCAAMIAAIVAAEWAVDPAANFRR